MTAPDQDAQRRILNRLKRARGQLDGVIAAVERGGSCREVVTQLSAVSSALDRAGFAIIATAMKDCVADQADQADGAEARGTGSGGSDDAGASGDDLTVAELEKLFLSLA